MDPHVFGLLEEMLSSDKTPEEVCRDRPDLLPELRQRWQEFRRIDAEVGEWYLKPESRVHAPLPADPPQVPGYELESELGRGGMGVVYKARHLALKRTVALKMLVGVSADRAERVRFGIEAEAVARLQHPNIVQVHEVGEAGGLPFLALEFVPGGSLAKRLAGQPLPPRDAARLVETLADAMHLAHSRNLVHRDLKPANILLTGGDETPFSQSQPKVADFGLARQLDSDSGQTQIGTVLGTPCYMAPEQAEGRAHAAGPAADIYSLGATLYECLTGRPPFQGTTSPETLEQVRTQEPASPSSLNRQIPRDLETICLKCLRKQPEQRYSSAHELGMDLGRFLRGEPVAARPIGVTERLRKWVRRHPAYAGLVAAAVLLAAAGLWLFQQRAQRRAELRNQVGTALALAEDLRNGCHFHEARELLENARQQVNLAGPADLRVLVNQAWDNLLMAENLDAARLRAFTLVMGRVDPAGAEPLYEKTFAQAGLGASGADSESVAAEVCKSPLRWQIVAALDDWAGITRDVRRQERLLAVARLADPDPARDSLRQPKLWRDGAKLTERARELRVAEVSPQLATTLSRVAYQNGGDALTLLRAAQSRFPHDFWLNFELGWAFCRATKWDDAVGYSRAAVALRPEASAPYTVLATALQGKGQIDEAIERFQQALDIDPKFVWAHDNLGSALRDRGRVEEAVAHFRKALDIEPQDAVAHNNLGIYLLTNGNLDEAISHFKESLRYERGQSPVVHVNLGLALADMGRLDEAIDYFQQAARLDPELLTARIAIGSFSYNDAQSALRDAAGQGAKKKRPAAPEQARLRRKALDRLRTILELTTKLLNSGNVLSWSLSDWQTDPVLASVRDPAELAKISDEERGEWQRLWLEVAALIAADPLAQGRALAARADWAGAADRYARILTRGSPRDGQFWFEYAALLLLCRDRAGCTKACASIVAACGKDGGPRPYYVARACTLAPDADAALPGRLAELELRAAPREFWSLTEQGALAHRAGRYQEATSFFEKSLAADSKPGRAVVNWLWLAVAKQRLGKAEEARRWLDKAQAWLDQYGAGMPERADEEFGLHLHNWLEANVLRREAEALIPPADKR